MPNLIIGARSSKLARWQANWIKYQLEKFHPGLLVEIEIIQTAHDDAAQNSAQANGELSPFSKEIATALLDRRVDLAIHSLEDLPPVMPVGLHLSAITERQDVRDALVVSAALREHVKTLKDLPSDVRLGANQTRRMAQLRHQRSDWQILPASENAETSLQELDEGRFDGVILAASELTRLGFSDRITAKLPPSELLSAAGQGAFGIASRLDDQRINLLLEPLNHWPTRYATEAERAVLRELGVDNTAPVAALGRVLTDRDGEKLVLIGLVIDLGGKRLIRQQISGKPYESEDLGLQLAQKLIAAGAPELLQKVENVAAVSAPLAQPAPQQEALSVAAASAGETVMAAPLPAPVLEVTETQTPAPAFPLAGCRVLITRALKQSNELSKALQNLGAEVTTCPLVEVRDPVSWAQLDRALIHLSWYDWLAFSSTQSVDSFLHRLDELGHGRAELMSHRVCAIGQKTAERLKREKISVDLRPERFTAEALLEEFIKRYGVRQRLRGARMLMPASAITRDVIRPAMDKVGVYVEVVEAFQVVLPASAAEDTLQNLRATPMDYAVFTSPATVANLATLFESDHLMPLLPNARVVCVNAATAETARSFGLEVHLETEEATGQALLAALVADRTQTSNS